MWRHERIHVFQKLQTDPRRILALPSCGGVSDPLAAQHQGKAEKGLDNMLHADTCCTALP